MGHYHFCPACKFNMVCFTFECRKRVNSLCQRCEEQDEHAGRMSAMEPHAQASFDTDDVYERR